MGKNVGLWGFDKSRMDINVFCLFIVKVFTKWLGNLTVNDIYCVKETRMFRCAICMLYERISCYTYHTLSYLSFFSFHRDKARKKKVAKIVGDLAMQEGDYRKLSLRK